MFCQSNFKIKHSNSSVCPEIHCVDRRVRNVGSSSSFLRTFSMMSFKIVDLLGHSTPGRRIWLKLSNRMPIDEIVFDYLVQLLWPMKTGCTWNRMTLCAKLIDQRRNCYEHSHIPECPGRNWNHNFWNWMKRWRIWAGKPMFKHKVQFISKLSILLSNHRKFS